MLCDDLDGVGGGGLGEGKSKREGIYAHIQLTDVNGQQKLMQHCKATVPRFLKSVKYADHPYNRVKQNESSE